MGSKMKRIQLPGNSEIEVKFNSDGLIPVVAQDVSGEVLMLAWMNDEAIRRTVVSRQMTYWSRSRQQYWVKGETSGHTQRLLALTIDCDRDALLAIVEQTGPACHTGARSCFFTDIVTRPE